MPQRTYFNYIDFQGVGGPNQLSGIRTSKVTPSYTYNSVNNPITPTAESRSILVRGILRQHSGRQREYDSSPPSMPSISAPA